jgi:hypothetical protein
VNGMTGKERQELDREASYLRFLLRVAEWANPDSLPLRDRLARLEPDSRVESRTDSSTIWGRVWTWRRSIPWAKPKR